MRFVFAVILTVAFLAGAADADDRKSGGTSGSQPKDDPSQIGNRDVGKGENFYSMEKEIALGKQLAQEVERKAKIVDDPIIDEHVNRVGKQLVRNSAGNVHFTIKVLESEEIKAFDLPGRVCFV